MKAFNFLFAFFIFNCLSAQTVSTYPELPYTTFSSFDISGDNIIALGSCNQVWTSTDQGVTWKYDEVNSIGNYNVKLIPGNSTQALISQFRGFVLYDFEQGVVNDFADVPELIDNVNNQLQVTNDKAYTFNSSGMYSADLSTYNWERIWQDTSENDVVVKSALTESFIYMGMLRGRVLRYEFATNEVEHVRDYVGRIGDIEMVDDNLGYIIHNENQKILKTTDGGFTYEELDGMPERINPKAYGEDILLSLNTNRIYKSTNGGISATYYQTANTPSLTYASNGMFTEDGTFYMIGRGSMLAKSTDFGETFTVVNPANRSNFYGIDIDDNGTGYVCGDFGSIVKTTDNGASWAPLVTDISSDETLTDIDILPNGNYLVSGYDGLHLMQGTSILNTTDLSSQSILITGAAILVLHDDSNGYNVSRSVDNGMTWTQVLTGLDYTFEMNIGNDGKIYIASQEDGIQVSSDGGLTWKVMDMGVQASAFYPVGNQKFLALDGRKIMKTEDDGQTWFEIQDFYGIRNIKIITEDHYIFTSRTQNETTLFETIDGGESWQKIFSNCSPTLALTINNKLEAVLAQEAGHINVAPLSDIFIATEDTELANKEVLFPSLMMTGGTFQSSAQWNSLQLFDINGRLIKSYNKFEAGISTDGMDAGYYLARFTTGEGTGVQKVVIY